MQGGVHLPATCSLSLKKKKCPSSHPQRAVLPSPCQDFDEEHGTSPLTQSAGRAWVDLGFVWKSQQIAMATQTASLYDS